MLYLMFCFGGAFPFKNNIAPHSNLDGLFEEEMFFVLFLSCLFPFSSTQIKTSGRSVEK